MCTYLHIEKDIQYTYIFIHYKTSNIQQLNHMNLRNPFMEFQNPKTHNY